MRTRIALIFSLLCTPLAFWACGDNAGNNPDDSEMEGSAVLENGDDPCIESSADGSEEQPSSSETFSSSSTKAAWQYMNPAVSYGEITDSRDDQVYKTVMIGEQVWMAENLNYADSVNTPSLKGNSWCYDNDEAKCEELGRFYTWDVAMEVCPDGWHLPTNSEWENLFAAVDEFGNAGALLKSESGWVNGGNGTDASGFAALPAGLSYSDGRSYYAGDYAHFWSASQSEDEDAGDYAYYVLLYSSHRYVNLSNYFKTYGYSVRCLQNSN